MTLLVAVQSVARKAATAVLPATRYRQLERLQPGAAFELQIVLAEGSSQVALFSSRQQPLHHLQASYHKGGSVFTTPRPIGTTMSVQRDIYSGSTLYRAPFLLHCRKPSLVKLEDFQSEDQEPDTCKTAHPIQRKTTNASEGKKTLGIFQLLSEHARMVTEAAQFPVP